LTGKTIICYQTEFILYIYCEAMKNKKIFDYKKNKPWAENMQIIMQLGLTMVGCVGFCFYIGFQIDKWLEIKGLFATVFIILGVIGGGVVVYRQIMEVFEDEDSQNGTN